MKEPKQGNWFKRHKILTAIFVVVILFLALGASESSKKDQAKTETKQEQTSSEAKVSADQDLASKVQASLDKLPKETKDMLASTSSGGYQGEIAGVEAHNDDTVKISVSTYFKETGSENDGGQAIARNIFSMVCTEVPELNSLYVTSSSSGLDSKSVYRSDVPACKQ